VAPVLNVGLPLEVVGSLGANPLGAASLLDHNEREVSGWAPFR
jgi:hypothetical protein